MLLFRLEFQPLLASLKLPEVAFDSVRILGVKFSSNFLPCLCLCHSLCFPLLESLYPIRQIKVFSCFLKFAVRLVLEAMLQTQPLPANFQTKQLCRQCVSSCNIVEKTQFSRFSIMNFKHLLAVVYRDNL